MKPRLFGFALSVSLFVFCVALRAAEAPKPPSPTTQRVVKLISTSGDERLPFGGGRNTGRGPGTPGRNNTANNNQPAPAYIIVTPPEGGQPVKLLVTDEFKRKLPGLANDRGELITVTVKFGSLGSEMVTAATLFDGNKALKDPHVYIFEGIGQQKVGIQAFTAAKLSKFGQSREVLVPNRASFDGAKPQPDPTIAAQLTSLTIGDPIEVDIAPGPAKNTFYLIDLDAPHDPLVGSYVKLTNLKDPANKTVAGIVLDVDGQEKSYALPAQTAGSPSNASAAAIAATAKSLKPGHLVQFDVRQSEGRLPTVRSLKLDGSIEPSNEKFFNLVSSYLKVEFSEGFFGRDINVDYRPGSTRADDQMLDRGVTRVLESEIESTRLKLTPEQTKQLGAAMDIKIARDAKPTNQEKAQWVAGYTAWTNAHDDISRAKIEQELLWAAQDLSMRWRNDAQSKYTQIRTILTPEQLEEVRKLGDKNRPPPPGA